MRSASWGFVLALSVFLAGCGGAPGAPDAERAARPDCDPDNGGITLPEGFCAAVVADDVGPARHLTVGQRGDIYVALQDRPEAQGAVAALRDTDGDGRMDVREYFGEVGGTGIGIHDGYLYFGRNTSIVRYRLNEGDLVPAGDAESFVEGLPEQRGHAAKPLAFDAAGSLYVNIGAPSNNCMEQMRTPRSPGRKPCPELVRQAGMWRFDVTRPGQTQQDGERYATGIRHAVAIAWNTQANALYAVQHGRDQLDTLWPGMFTAEQNAELPSEEFIRVDRADDFGWPYCYHDPQQNRRVVAPEYGGDGRQTGDCDKYETPLLAFPAHYAPNDLIFYTGGQFPDRFANGAFVAFHGSWNRAPLPQRGYKVAFVPMADGRPAGDWEVFADGFAGEKPIPGPGDAAHRPMGLAQGPDGSLYISDSVKGRIWRVIYRGS